MQSRAPSSPDWKVWMKTRLTQAHNFRSRYQFMLGVAIIETQFRASTLLNYFQLRRVAVAQGKTRMGQRERTRGPTANKS